PPQVNLAGGRSLGPFVPPVTVLQRHFLSINGRRIQDPAHSGASRNGAAHNGTMHNGAAHNGDPEHGDGRRPTHDTRTTPLDARQKLVSQEEMLALERCWRNDPRWHGVTRSYNAEKVLRLRGTLKIEHTIADKMSHKLWRLL